MISYPNMQQYAPSYQNNYNQYQNNYNQYSYNQPIQQNYNNYSTSIYPQQNYLSNTNISNTNIFNNYGGYQMMQQPMVMQQPMMIQQQPMMIQQQPMMVQQQQQSDSSGFMQQLIMMLLSSLLQPAVEEAPVEQTEIIDESVGVWGDPHFDAVGADGKTKIRFDQKGKVGDTYNVFKGDGYEVDARYDNWNGGYAIMGEAKIKAGADTIGIAKDGTITVNNKVIKDGKTVKLNDGTKLVVTGKNAVIESRDGDSKINITNGGGYLNVDPTGKFSGLGGILGTAMAENKNLTEEECEKFNVTTNKNKKID